MANAVPTSEWTGSNGRGPPMMGIIRRIACIRGCETFFPHPTDSCHSFFKGREYLAVASYLAETPYAEVDALVAVMDPGLEAQERVVSRDPEVLLQRGRVGEAFGVALRD